MVGTELLLADANQLLGERSQRLAVPGVQVVTELGLEPSDVVGRIGLAAVVLRLDERAARRRVDASRRIDRGARAPE